MGGKWVLGRRLRPGSWRRLLMHKDVGKSRWFDGRAVCVKGQT